jgi:hypothetical protein
MSKSKDGMTPMRRAVVKLGSAVTDCLDVGISPQMIVSLVEFGLRTWNRRPAPSRANRRKK